MVVQDCAVLLQVPCKSLHPELLHFSVPWLNYDLDLARANATGRMPNSLCFHPGMSQQHVVCSLAICQTYICSPAAKPCPIRFWDCAAGADSRFCPGTYTFLVASSYAPMCLSCTSRGFIRISGRHMLGQSFQSSIFGCHDRAYSILWQVGKHATDPLRGLPQQSRPLNIAAHCMTQVAQLTPNHLNTSRDASWRGFGASDCCWLKSLVKPSKQSKPWAQTRMGRGALKSAACCVK